MSNPTAAPEVTGSQNPGQATRYRVVVAVLLFLTLLVSFLDRTNISVLNADPTFQKDMGVVGQPAQMGLLMTVFLLAYGVGNIILAPLGNRLGPRKAMVLAIAIWFAATLAGGLVGSFGLMLAVRVVLGFGEGLHWPMQSLYVTNWFPLKERGKANSAWLVGLMVGPMLGVPLIAALVKADGWRYSFYVLAAISLIPMILIAFLAPDHPTQSRFTNQAEVAHIQSDAVATGDTPARADWSFLKSGNFWLIVVAYLASSSMFWGTMTWLPTYLSVARKFAWAQMGFLASLPYLLGAATVLIFGAVADRFVKKAIFPTVALTGTALSILAAALVSDNVTSALLMAVAFAFLGSGLSSYWTIMQNTVHRGSVGAAAGVLNGVAQIGSAFIPTIVGILIGTAGAYTNGLLFLVVMGAVGAVSAGVLMARGK
jgi:sugar phosphate permease